MLTVRIGSALTARGRTRAMAISRALQAHLLTPHLKATVLIGPGGTGGIRLGDPRPLIVVALNDILATAPLSRAIVSRADGVVIAERDIPAALLSGLGDAVVIDISQAQGDDKAFLRGASHDESQSAWDAMGSNPSLAAAILNRGTDSQDSIPMLAAQVADAVTEAVVAAGRDYTRDMERPAG